MVNTLSSYINRDLVPLFDDYEQICPKNDIGHFKYIHNFLNRPSPIRNIDDIYLLYIHAMKIAKNLTISEDSNLKNRFSSILNALNGKKILQENALQSTLDFTFILDTIKQGKIALLNTVEVVDYQDDLKVQEAAEATNTLMLQGTGQNFGLKFLSTRIRSPEAWCAVIRNEQKQIIAAILATYLRINDSSTTAFHINILVRSPKYPLTNSKQHLLKKAENSIMEKLKPDFISLCVRATSFVKESYKESGFEEESSNPNKFLGCKAAFMTKNYNTDIQNKLSYVDLRKSMDAFNKKEAEQEILN